jgi:Na+/H+ antiporter NhaC
MLLLAPCSLLLAPCSLLLAPCSLLLIVYSFLFFFFMRKKIKRTQKKKAQIADAENGFPSFAIFLVIKQCFILVKTTKTLINLSKSQNKRF